VVTVVVDDVSPAAAVVLDPVPAVEPVEPVSAVVDDDDAPVAAWSSSPRLPGWAIARTTPTMKRSAAAAPRIANLRFRGDSPHLVLGAGDGNRTRVTSLEGWSSSR
jgi:hypothetical protein